MMRLYKGNVFFDMVTVRQYCRSRSEHGIRQINMIVLIVIFGLIGTIEPGISNKCPELTAPDNGNLDYSGSVNSYVAYTCHDGYDLIGSNYALCQSNFTWSIDPPTCRIKDCGLLNNITNGMVSLSNGSTFGETANYTCDTGYSMTGGDRIRYCTDQGFWNGTEPICSDIDECAMNTDNCDTNANCTNTDGSFTCTCYPGFSGTGVNCTDVDECSLRPDSCDTNANCSNTVGSYRCACNTGYSGDGFTCTDVDECTEGISGCHVNANCTNIEGSFTCTCTTGYSGDGFTCTDVDECTRGTHSCDVNANCTNIVGSFTCSCNIGFSGDGFSCSDIDECSEGISGCHINANCTNSVGSFTCSCGTGYSGDGFTCTDINECTEGTSVCGVDANCTNSEGSFTCTCNTGYTWDGFNCTDMDECSLTIHNCDRDANCTNTVGSFTCSCNAGYSGDGFNCTDIDECEAGSSDCHTNANCTNTEGSYICTCHVGYEGDGTNCTNINECQSGPCNNGGTCVDGINMFTCDCLPGFTDTLCRPSMLYDNCSSRSDICTGLTNVECNGTVCACYTGHYDPGNDTCLPVDCGSLSDPDNGQVNTSPGTTYNRAATYNCNTGYNLTASNIRFCLANGSWEGVTPQCVLDDCGPLTNITNGYVSIPGGTTYSQTAAYTCDTGYYISAGNQTRVCQDRGSWSGLEPNCTIQDCLSLSNITNGYVTTSGGTTYSQIAIYTCVAGYSVSTGDQTRVCQADGNWNGTEPTCSDTDECALNTDTCDINANCTNTVGSYTCTCNTGYSGDGLYCTDIDECREGTSGCDGNANCTNSEGSFTCTCTIGYSGDGFMCTDIDECALGTNNCDRVNAYCNNTAGSHTCTCHVGYTGDGTSCTDIDECAVNTHTCDTNANCTNTEGSFTCSCNPGYSGDGNTCTDIDECVSTPCQNNGTCINGINMFTCNCTPGYTDITCRPSVLYDNCFSRSDVCTGLTNAECNGTVCACSTGHYDPGNDTCLPVDCGSLSNPDNGQVNTSPGTTYNRAATYNCDTGYNLTASNMRFCLANGSWEGVTPQCVFDDCGPLTNISNGFVSIPGGTTYDQTATYTCDTGYYISAGNQSRICQDGGGWSGVEPNCTIHDCLSLSNITNGYVVTSGGTTYSQIAIYTCVVGYSVSTGEQTRVCLADGNWNGTEPTCSDTDECALNTDTCDINANCTNTVGSYTCTCNTGYSGDGYNCSDINECTEGTSGCHVNANCTNIEGSFTCTCTTGYSGDGFTCTDIDECALNIDSCDITANCTNTVGSYTCTCNTGYSGDGFTCTDINECTERILGCDVNANCTNSVGSFSCACITGYSGDGFTCTDIDECTLSIDSCDNNATCNNTVGSYTCTCDIGYTGDGFTCTDINECTLNTHTCDTNANCTNTEGSFTCSCNPGYSGDGNTCTDIDECSSTPCQNNGTCINGINIFTCNCTPGYTDITCRPSVLHDNCSSRSDICTGLTNAECNGTVCACSTGHHDPGNDTCLPVDCGSLSDPDNGQVNTSPGTTYNRAATYSCDTGYNLTTSNRRFCLANGSWEGNDPLCMLDDCGLLTNITNGYVSTPGGTTYNQTATYTCDTGYFISAGNQSRVCQDGGSWLGAEPVCTQYDCGMLNNITDGTVSVTGTKYGSLATYTCSTGHYISAGHENRTCGNGTWGGVEPTCTIYDCGTLNSTMLNGTVTNIGGSVYLGTYNYSCDTGFFISEGVIALTLTCLSNGSWDGSMPNCLPVDCGNLEAPRNGQVNTEPGTKYLDFASYTCNKGYLLSGPNVQQCMADGNWEPLPPICNIIDCGNLTDPANGTITLSNGTTYGQIADYSCFTGYQLLNGSQQRSCNISGFWTGTAPVCEIYDCGPLSTSISNGQGFQTGTVYQSMTTYTCNTGYWIMPSNMSAINVTCNATGSWDDEPPSCVLIDCGALFAPTGGQINYPNTTYNSDASYTCDPGWTLNGTNVRRCGLDGQWSLQEPFCDSTDCGSVNSIANGSYSLSGSTFYNSVVTYACDLGFYLVGNKERICQLNATWSGTEPRCDMYDCGSLTAPVNGSMNLNRTTYGAMANFTCDVGFDLIGDALLTCMSDGNWSSAAPTCQIKDCGIPVVSSNITHIANLTILGNWTVLADLINPGNFTFGNLSHVVSGNMVLTGTTYEQLATFSCFVGFMITGSNVSLCGSNGDWSSEVPVCRLIDCGPLSDLSDGTINLSNGSFFNSRATYTCNTGYYISGNGQRVCLGNGSWTGDSPLCTIHDCGSLTRPENGNMVVTTTTFGSTAVFSCSIGFDLSGNDTLLCESDGRWSAQEPICIVTDCGQLSNPDNGNISVSGTTFGGQAIYTCQPGYDLSGVRVRVCQSSGQWSGTIPTCQPMDCGQILAPINGFVNTSAGTSFGDTAVYGCNTGYRLQGSNTTVCSTSGTWNPPFSPSCTRIDCGQLSRPVNGQVDLSEGFYYDDKAIFSCNPGYSLRGPNTTTCQANGQWNVTTVSCVIKDCGPVDTPLNGEVDLSDGTVYGSTATFSCHTGYYMNGTSQYNCTESGSWFPRTTAWPQCTLYDCGNLTSPMNGRFQYLNSFRSKYGGQATFTCDRGYRLNGTAITQCTSNGTWSVRVAPTCLIKDCGTLDAPLNGNVTFTNGTVYGSIARFTCDVGHDMTGISEVNCTDIGQWSGTPPVCQPYNCGVLRGLENGGVNLTYSTLFPSMATYHCDTGYFLRGTKTRNCTERGQWEPFTPPECYIIDCGTLTSPENGNIDLSNGTTYGQIAVFTCSLGYDVFGSSRLECQEDRQWSAPSPSCQITDCGSLDNPANGTVRVSNTTFGHVAEYSCRTGFQISSVTNRTCQTDGNWTFPVPTCTIRDCGELQHPSFGSVTLTSGTTYNSVATYTCDVGYYRVGDGTRTCTSVGAWDGQPPICRIYDCGGFPVVENSNLVGGTSTLYGTVLTYICHVGFNLRGNSNVTCTQSGWEPAPICDIVDCGPLLDPSNGYVIVQGGTAYRQTATYYCSTGYILEGLNLRTCTATGTWNSTVPACRIADCGQLDSIKNGRVIVVAGTSYGSSASYICNTGYQLTGSSTRFCQASEQWSGQAPSCRIIDCGNVTAPKFGNLTLLNGTTYGNVAIFACRSFYSLNGPSTIVCRSNGSWSDTPPTCVLQENIQDVDVQLSFNLDVTEADLSNDTVYEAYRGETRQGLLNHYTSRLGSDVLDVEVTNLKVGSLIADATVIIKDSPQASLGLGQTLSDQLNGTAITLFNQTTNSTLISVDGREDCGILPNISNGYVELPQGTLFGNTVIYRCVEGYTLTGHNTRTCQLDDSWAPPEPSCAPKDCGTLAPLNNGQVIIPVGTTLGNVATFLCNPGYSVIGPSQVTCQTSGNWSDSPPVCELTLCGGLENPDHGRVRLSADRLTATYICNDGYWLQGTNARICSTVTLKWTGRQPTCLLIDCGILLNPENGIVDLTSGTTFGKVATYICVTPGYVLSGLKTRECGMNGWSDVEPVCVIKDCGMVDPVLNGQINISGTMYGSTVLYQCDTGYRLVGEQLLTCTVSGWSFPEPICVASGSCPVLSKPIHGLVNIVGGVSYGGKAYYQCYTGYLLIGTSVRTCQNNSTWSGSAPTCVLQECPFLTDLEGGTVEMPNGNTYGETANITCNPGYNLIGPQVVTCQQDGSWSYSTTCVIKNCGSPGLLKHGKVDTMTGTTFNSTAIYVCDPGYDLEGQSEVMCLSTGTWDTNRPTCVIKDCRNVSAPENGFVNLPSGTVYGRTANYGCNRGYNLTGSVIRQCTEYGVWTGGKPFCNIVECGTLASVLNGQVTVTDGHSYGSVATYSCDTGYWLSRNNVTSSCMETGSWTNLPPPTCELVDCGSLSAPMFGTVDLSNGTTYGSVGIFSCQTGYIIDGAPVRLCLASGQWDRDQPSCVVADCGPLGNPVNGKVELLEGSLFGKVATYKCNSQHNLKGTASRTCTADGSWSGTEPRCDSTEFALAVGLGVGLTGFVILVVIIALVIALLYKKHRQDRQTRRRRYRKISRELPAAPLKATTASYIVPYINRPYWAYDNDGSVASYRQKVLVDDGDPSNPLYQNVSLYQNDPR